MCIFCFVFYLNEKTLIRSLTEIYKQKQKTVYLFINFRDTR